jgi:hypothetical protein
LTLTDLLPQLPPEARDWIAGLDASDYATTERILNRIGAENFITHWQTHRADQQDAALSFPTTDGEVTTEALQRLGHKVLEPTGQGVTIVPVGTGKAKQP